MTSPRGYSARPRTTTLLFGLPDRSGVGRYTHLIRALGDPDETRARGAKARHEGAREPGWAKRAGRPEEWADRIVELLADGRPRTFNAIAVALLGVTADALFETPVDAGLWLAVEQRRIGWTPTAPPRFAVGG